jgi:hypothetical protein
MKLAYTNISINKAEVCCQCLLLGSAPLTHLSVLWAHYSCNPEDNVSPGKEDGFLTLQFLSSYSDHFLQCSHLHIPLASIQLFTGHEQKHFILLYTGDSSPESPELHSEEQRSKRCTKENVLEGNRLQKELIKAYSLKHRHIRLLAV